VGATAGRTGTLIAGSTIGVMSLALSRDGLSVILVGSSPGSLLASTGAGGESGGVDAVPTALANAVGWQNKFASLMPRERVSCARHRGLVRLATITRNARKRVALAKSGEGFFIRITRWIRRDIFLRITHWIRRDFSKVGRRSLKAAVRDCA